MAMLLTTNGYLSRQLLHLILLDFCTFYTFVLLLHFILLILMNLKLELRDIFSKRVKKL